MHMQLRGAKYKLKYAIRYSDWWKFYSYYFGSKSENVEKSRHFDLWQIGSEKLSNDTQSELISERQKWKFN